MRPNDPNQEDRQNPGLAHDAGRRGEADHARQPPVAGVGRGLDEDTGSPTSSGFGV